MAEKLIADRKDVSRELRKQFMDQYVVVQINGVTFMVGDEAGTEAQININRSLSVAKPSNASPSPHDMNINNDLFSLN